MNSGSQKTRMHYALMLHNIEKNPEMSDTAMRKILSTALLTLLPVLVLAGA